MRLEVLSEEEIADLSPVELASVVPVSAGLLEFVDRYVTEALEPYPLPDNVVPLRACGTCRGAPAHVPGCMAEVLEFIEREWT